ncbi:MAG: hypothetical protein ISP90_16745 [Nevskia sp.]|nr:hypothetical protein [Nevskia sp.]
MSQDAPRPALASRAVALRRLARCALAAAIITTLIGVLGPGVPIWIYFVVFALLLAGFYAASVRMAEELYLAFEFRERSTNRDTVGEAARKPGAADGAAQPQASEKERPKQP